MKRLNSILSLLLVLALCTATVSAAPLAEPISASGSEAVSASVYEEITRSTGELDVEQVGSINLGLALMYRAYFKTDHGTVLPDYFAGFYTDSNGFTVMGLTEITDEILAEIRTAFYSYRSGTGEAGDIAYMDRWFPTIRYQLMEYSYNQLAELENAIDDALKENGEENFRAIADLEINQVLLFCETETARECALELAGAEPDMLQTRPFTAFESWVAESSAPPQTTQTSETPADPASETASGIMAGMRNTFYNASGSMSSGTVGFTAFLNYCGSGNSALGLVPGANSVAVFFTHGHNISNLYPYSSVQTMYAGDLLYCNTTVDYSFYLPRDGAAVSAKRFGSAQYFTSYCTDEDDIEYCIRNKNYSGAAFYGSTSGEKSFAKTKLSVDSGVVSWADSSAVSQQGDSGGPIYFVSANNGGTNLVLIAIISTSNQNSGGEGQTIYSIINDLDNNSDFEFDGLYSD